MANGGAPASRFPHRSRVGLAAEGARTDWNGNSNQIAKARKAMEALSERVDDIVAGLSDPAKTPARSAATFDAGDMDYAMDAMLDGAVSFTLVSTTRTVTLPDWTTAWTASRVTNRGWGRSYAVFKYDTTGTHLNIVPQNGFLGYNGVKYYPNPGVNDPLLYLPTAGCILVQAVNGGFVVESFMAGES